MPKKTGLGKGLDALFGPTPEEEQVKEDDVLKNLKITEVEPNREQPRKNFNQESPRRISRFNKRIWTNTTNNSIRKRRIL